MDTTRIPANLISSQRFIDESIVAAKQNAEDYTVQVATVEVDDVEYQVVVDGHHSLEAARRDGVQAEFEGCNPEIQREASRDGNAYLLAHQMDSDWYFVATGKDVW